MKILLACLATALVAALPARAQDNPIPGFGPVEVPDDFEEGGELDTLPPPPEPDARDCTYFSQGVDYRLEYEDGGAIADTIEYGRPFRVVVPYVACEDSHLDIGAQARVRLAAPGFFSREMLVDLAPRDPSVPDPRTRIVYPGDPLPPPLDLVSAPIVLAPYDWQGLTHAGVARERVPDRVAD